MAGVLEISVVRLLVGKTGFEVFHKVVSAIGSAAVDFTMLVPIRTSTVAIAVLGSTTSTIKSCGAV